MKNPVAISATVGTTQALAWASSFFLPAVVAVPIARDLGLTPEWIYAGLSVGLGVAALLGPLAGRVIDAEGGRPVLCGSNAVFALGLILVALSRGPVSLMLAWLVIGIAMAGGLYEAAFAALTRLYGYAARGAITGVTLIAGFSSTVGWPTTAFLEHRFGWRGACCAWAALHLMLGLPLNAWALRHGKATPPAVPTRGPAGSEEASTSQRGGRALGLMFTASGMVTIGLATNLPGLFVALGAAPVAAIAAASLLGPAQVVARGLEFTARRHINPLSSSRIAVIAHPLAALTVAIGGAPVIAIFAIVHGAGSGMLTISRGTLPLALFGPHGFGARIGRITAPARIGQAIAPFLFGVAINRFGEATLLLSCTLSCIALLAMSGLTLPREFRPVHSAGSDSP